MSYQLGQDWQRQAACLEFEPEMFVPSGSGRPPQHSKHACATCPVRVECEEFVLSSPWKPYGTWAGMSQKELEPLWRDRHPPEQSQRGSRPVVRGASGRGMPINIQEEAEDDA